MTTQRWSFGTLDTVILVFAVIFIVAVGVVGVIGYDIERHSKLNSVPSAPCPDISAVLPQSGVIQIYNTASPDWDTLMATVDEKGIIRFHNGFTPNQVITRLLQLRDLQVKHCAIERSVLQESLQKDLSRIAGEVESLRESCKMN